MQSYADIGDFFNCYVKAEEPTNKIYEFTGTFIFPSKPGDEVNIELQEPLSLENTMWADTVVASQGFVLGLVLYVGRETRSQMNGKMARSKMSQLDNEVNFLSKLLFGMMVLLALAITILNGFQSGGILYFVRSVLLLSSIIPISLRVNLDLAKLYYSYTINSDEEISGSTARNSNIPEDLGRLSYLISDKTGTLTQNEMLLKKVCTEAAIFPYDDNDMRQLLNENCEKFPGGPCNAGPDADNKSAARSKKSTKDTGNQLRDLITAFALCNNVTPVVEDPDIDKVLEVNGATPKKRTTYAPNQTNPLFSGSDIRGNVGSNPVEMRSTYMPRPASPTKIEGFRANANIIFEGSSPDEIALVKFAHQVGQKLVERDRTYVQLKNCAG